MYIYIQYIVPNIILCIIIYTYIACVYYRLPPLSRVASCVTHELHALRILLHALRMSFMRNASLSRVYA